MRKEKEIKIAANKAENYREFFELLLEISLDIRELLRKQNEMLRRKQYSKDTKK